MIRVHDAGSVALPCTIVAMVETTIVGAPVDSDPVRLVDPARILRRRADRKRRCDFQPTLIDPRDPSNFIGNFGEVLILAEYQGYIIAVFDGQADDVEGDPHVDTFLMPGQAGVLPPVGKPHGLVLVTKRTGIRPDITSPHLSQLRLPELVQRASSWRAGTPV